jgi:predicted enzyme related to lactoylglutathione lyase
MKYSGGVCLITGDAASLAEFYQKVLQVKTEINDTHVQIELDGGGITIYSKTAAERDMGFDFSKYHGTGMTEISFFVDDVDAEYERIKSLNLNIEFAAVLRLPLGRPINAFSDPMAT